MKGNPGQSWILDSTPWISDSRYWIPDSWSVELRSWIPIVSGIPDSYSHVPDSKAQDSWFHRKIFPHFGFHKQKFPGFRNPDFLWYGAISSVIMISADLFSKQGSRKGRTIRKLRGRGGGGGEFSSRRNFVSLSNELKFLVWIFFRP